MGEPTAGDNLRLELGPGGRWQRRRRQLDQSQPSEGPIDFGPLAVGARDPQCLLGADWLGAKLSAKARKLDFAARRRLNVQKLQAKRDLLLDGKDSRSGPRRFPWRLGLGRRRHVRAEDTP